jgi:hypothetical protein
MWFGEQRVIGVIVYVDESRRDYEAGGINGALPGDSVQVADVCDLSGANSEVRPFPRDARAVNHHSVGDDDVIRAFF